jgi:methyl-accepting chemotaxis protein
VLEAIAGAASESGGHMEAIGRATVEQAATAQHLVQIFAGVNEQARQIDSDVTAQRASQDAALEVADAVRGAARSVHRSTEDQARSLALLREGASTVDDSCALIQRAIQGQSADCESSVAVIQSLEAHARKNAEAIDRFAGAIEELRSRGSDLRERIARFST